MSTSTTNFGWTVPSDTDLVKDGAGAIRTALGGVDTSFVDLKGGTTGQVLSKASGTDLDFTWIAQDDSNAIQNAIVDAKGDLIAATAADTPARLAVGTNGQVLTADSSEATGMKWAAPASGGMTLLSTTTLSGSSTSISVTPTGYEKLFISIYGMNISANNIPRIQFNSDSTAGNYTSYWAGSVGYGTTAGYSVSGELVPLGFPTTNGLKNGTANTVFSATVFDPNSTLRKVVQVNGAFYNDSNYDSNLFVEGAYLGSSAISSIQVLVTSGTFSAGTVKVYGVK